jgi:hypothetical protein
MRDVVGNRPELRKAAVAPRRLSADQWHTLGSAVVRQHTVLAETDPKGPRIKPSLPRVSVLEPEPAQPRPPIAGIGKLNHAAQTGRHRHADRGADLYETPVCAIEPLLAAEQLPHVIWEPAAGRGAIVDVLRGHGHSVICSDIQDYGYPLDFVADFLTIKEAPSGCEALITNPPYRIATEFAAHAIDLVPQVFLLLRLAFLESAKRAPILDTGKLARIHVFKKRLPMMHRDGWSGPRASSAIPFAWFVWSREHRGPTIIDRIGGTNRRSSSPRPVRSRKKSR